MSLPPVVWYGDRVDLSGSDSDGEIGRRGLPILALVHHRIVGSLESAIREFTDDTASGQRRRVSSTFAIGYLGSKLVIAQFVAVENTAYCNGQTPADRAACRWKTWIAAGKPGTNYITVSTEHEDNGAAGDYIVVDAIVEASIALDRLLLSGDGQAIRAAGIRCSDLAAKQLAAIEPSTETLIDHNVCAPVSKPFCWRAIGKDKGFPQARFVAALTKEADVPGVRWEFEDTARSGWATVVGDDHLYLNLSTGLTHPIPPGRKRGLGPATLLDRGITGTTDTRRTGFVINKEAAFVITADVKWEPDAEPNDAIEAELERAADRAHDAVLAR